MVVDENVQRCNVTLHLVCMDADHDADTVVDSDVYSWSGGQQKMIKCVHTFSSFSLIYYWYMLYEIAGDGVI